MKKNFPEDELFPYLMGTYWFRETIDLYFDSRHEMKYNEIVKVFIKRGLIRLENGRLSTPVNA